MSKKMKAYQPRHHVDQLGNPLGMCRSRFDTLPVEARAKNGKTIMPTQGWVAIADVPDEWVGREVEWTWASADRVKEPWCYVAGSSVLHAVRHRTNVDMGPMCRVTYRGEEAEISGARLRLRIADSSGRYSLFECERSDPAGIRELLERAERESLEVTVESPANGIVRGVPMLIDSFGGERKTGVHVPGNLGYNTTWLPDSWARESVWPNGLGNVVSRVTLHLTAAPTPAPDLVASGDDWAGIRELLERSGRENLEVTVESRGRAWRRVQKTVGWFVMIGHDESVWLPDSWGKQFSGKPKPSDNVVERVTLHLTADHARPAVQNSEHVVVREPAPAEWDLNPPIKRPARERCPDCHGLGVMHTPSWKPPRDCTTCEPPAAAKVWTMEKTGDAHCGEPAAVVAWWNIAVDGVVVATVATSYRDHRDHPTGQSGPYTLASVWWGAPVPGNNRPSSRGVCEVIGEHCHEMAAARVFAGIRNGTVVP